MHIFGSNLPLPTPHSFVFHRHLGKVYDRSIYLDAELAGNFVDVELAEVPGTHDNNGLAGHDEALRPGQHGVDQGADRRTAHPGLHALQHRHLVQAVVGVDRDHHRHDGTFCVVRIRSMPVERERQREKPKTFQPVTTKERPLT